MRACYLAAIVWNVVGCAREVKPADERGREIPTADTSAVVTPTARETPSTEPSVTAPSITSASIAVPAPPIAPTFPKEAGFSVAVPNLFIKASGPTKLRPKQKAFLRYFVVNKTEAFVVVPSARGRTRQVIVELTNPVGVRAQYETYRFVAGTIESDTREMVLPHDGMLEIEFDLTEFAPLVSVGKYSIRIHIKDIAGWSSPRAGATKLFSTDWTSEPLSLEMVEK